MKKNQLTGSAMQPQCNRNATANYVNLIMTSTVQQPTLRFAQVGLNADGTNDTS